MFKDVDLDSRVWVLDWCDLTLVLWHVGRRVIRLMDVSVMCTVHTVHSTGNITPGHPSLVIVTLMTPRHSLTIQSRAARHLSASDPIHHHRGQNYKEKCELRAELETRNLAKWRSFCDEDYCWESRGCGSISSAGGSENVGTSWIMEIRVRRRQAFSVGNQDFIEDDWCRK